MSCARRCFILVAASAIAALLHGLLVGPPPEEPGDDGWALDLAGAAQLEQVIWVDSRAAELYAAAHLPQAIHLTFDDWDAGLGLLLLEWDPDRPVIVYCDGDGCESSRAVAARLRSELETDSVYWLRGGWPGLVQGGFVQ
jgi:rhodanese-related sulfurtransferase